MAKGIRVNSLAKELGVESKAILEKLRTEGLSVPNHQSTVSIGLSETIREWFSGHDSAGGGGTAVETAQPVEAATLAKAKTARSRKKKMTEVEEPPAEPTLEAPAVEEPVVIAEVAPAPEAAGEATPSEPTTTIESSPAAPIVEQEPPAAASPAEAPAEPEAPALRPAASVPTAPAAPTTTTAPSGPSAAPGVRAPVGAAPDRAVMRPTVTLQSRAAAERAPLTPPTMVVPSPAKLQGPKIVRVEKPDHVPLPRPRRPMETGAPAPGFSTARPTTGRGVKTADDDEEEKKNAAKKGASSLSARRRGVDGRRGEAMEKLKEFSEQDLKDRHERLNAAASTRAAVDSHLKKTINRGTHAIAKTGVQKGEPIEIEEPITVKSFSAALGIKTNDILKKLMSQGVFANINQGLDVATATALAMEWGIELQVAQQASLEDTLVQEFDQRESKPEEMLLRPPVVTILGHVDHGKTSLLDKIRSANVAAGEAGGITQHTAAWMVTLGEGEKSKRVTFIDTPGHQAFTSMRARGANMTDVVVLVVAAVEGVMPQTVESINHARAAGVPIVVALNKSDRAEANPDMVLGQLAANGLNPVEWGGDTEVIRTSATTGQGIKELIEILDYQAELLELKANPENSARGTVIESRIDPGLGSVATVLVQDGTLYVGDIMLSGPGYGRIRSLHDDHGNLIDTAGPSTPVIVSGLNSLPSAGDKFFIVDNLDRARSIAEERTMHERTMALGTQNRVTAGNLLETIAAGDVKTIHLIIKADVQGSVETLVKTVGGQNTQEVQVKVIHSGVGAVSESDVELAMATRINPTDPQRPNKVAIIGFHVVPDDSARALAEQNHIDVKNYRVIYEIFDDLKKALSGMLSKEVREKIHGHVEVRAVFKVSRLGNIAGGMCTDGHIVRTDKVRLIRDGKVITEGISIESLKRVKDDVKEVKSGFECGVKLAGYDDIKIGDRFEAYITEEFERTL
ncbi:hypothetical protein BH09PLA1_BH09PLA1_22910 [soil metagenome]